MRHQLISISSLHSVEDKIFFGKLEGIEQASFSLNQMRVIHKNPRHILGRIVLGDHHFIAKLYLEPNRKTLRKIEYRLKHIFRNPAQRSIRGSRLLRRNRIDTPLAIGWGTTRSEQRGTESLAVFEFCEGTLLKDLPSIPRRKRASSVARQLHGRGLLHGDISLNNILIAKSPKHQILLLDTDRIKPNCAHGTLFAPLLTTFCFRRLEFSDDPDQQRYSLLRFLVSYCGTTRITNQVKLYYCLIQIWRWYDAKPLSRLRRKLQDFGKRERRLCEDRKTAHDA